MREIIEEITYLSELETIAKVESFVENLTTQYNIGDDLFGNMIVSITEAVNNAIIHGNKRVKSKKIHLTQSVESDSHILLCIKIEDEGDGFDYNNLPDPTAPENVNMVGGRGIFLIKHLADFVIFNDKGNSIELQFKI